MAKKRPASWYWENTPRIVTGKETSEEMRAVIESVITEHGGFNAAGLAALGIKWPPPKGWRRKLLRTAQANDWLTPERAHFIERIETSVRAKCQADPEAVMHLFAHQVVMVFDYINILKPAGATPEPTEEPAPRPEPRPRKPARKAPRTTYAKIRPEGGFYEGDEPPW